jgi:hypothetical protein
MIIGNLRSRKDYKTKMNDYQNILNKAINSKKTYNNNNNIQLITIL